MKLYSLVIPLLFAALFTNNGNLNEPLQSENILSQVVVHPDWPKPGSVSGEQDFTACNLCASCMPECLDSDDACAGAIITGHDISCRDTSPIAHLSFPGNQQYICSIQKIGPYTWYVEFNVIQYSCDRSDTPFTFDIPIVLSYSCPRKNYNIEGSVNFIIC